MNPKKIRKGMILCAGLGTRLLPITEKYPKPIVPVLNIPNVLHNLFLLKQAGVEEFVINLHHLPGFIKKLLGDGRRWGTKISYSQEEVLLGTGGGLKAAEKFFEGEPFVLANCDFISDVDLRPFITRHFARNATATMVLFEDLERQALYSPVGVTAENNLCSLPKLKVAEPKRSGIFTGIHVLENRVLEYLRTEPSGINEVLYPALMKEHPQKVFGDFMQGGYWFDTGDLPALWSTTMHLLDALSKEEGMLRNCLGELENYEERSPGIWVPHGENLPQDLKLHAPVILGRECAYGSQIELGPYAVIGDRASLADGLRVERSILLSESETTERSYLNEVILFENQVLSNKKKRRA